MLNEKFNKNFSLMVNSLKLAQRAELWDDEHNSNIVERLYVDPLPSDGVLRQVVQDSTVFLVGRKGTGKSTVFARAQEYFRNSKSEISAYVDIKTVYGRSQAKEGQEGNEEYETFMLYEKFINEIISDLLSEVKKSLEQKNVLFKLWKKRDFNKIINTLEKLAIKSTNIEFREIDFERKVNTTEIFQNENENENGLSVGVTATTTTVGAKAKNIITEKTKEASAIREEYSQTLLRHFNLNGFISEIKIALESYGIKKLHIILDDFSEIDYEAQKVFVDTILAPLNNWSDKFIRFKVGAYPKRIFYGDIDKGKIDEITLDYYELYKVKDLPELEKKATEFLNRLLEARIKYFLEVDIEEIFAIDNENTWDDYLDLLFYTTMNIPRILGHILHYCYHSAIIYDRKITRTLIEQAAQKYYENQIKYYFDKTNYLKEAFEEKLDRASQRKLVELIVDKAKKLKLQLRKDNTKLFKDIPANKIPTSHFFINKEYEKFLHSLELNYLVSKYYEQSDRDGILISIYAINYGLCREQNINFGRPKNGSIYRKYFISRHFNNDKLLQQHLLKQKVFVCRECNYEYPYSEYDTLHKIGMICYSGCKKFDVVEEKFKNDNLFEDIREENLLPEVELGILHILKQNVESKLYASLIARELDCSHQLVSKRSEKLQAANLITKKDELIDGKPRKIYLLTEKAEILYFQNENKVEI